MSSNLGKRKRHAAEAIVAEKRESSEDSGSEIDAQELFRRHFEAKFKPLAVVQKPQQVEEEGSEDEEEEEEESDWDGFIDAVEVVEHMEAKKTALMSKEELKAFMSPRPPSSTPLMPLSTGKKGSTDEDDTSESANLRHDLELQRFLTESHLLSTSTTSAVGSNRHKATDLRLQALGSKTSILKQEKMPLAHRKGIIARAGEKEDRRRREARENGIILEKATGKQGRGGVTKKVGTGSSARRDRGVGAPGVGRFDGGTLRLSKKDIYEIEGPKKSFSGSGKGGRGGRGGGRGRGKRGRG